MRRAARPDCSDATTRSTVALGYGVGCLVEVLLRQVTDRFRGPFLDLSLNLCSRRGVIDEDAELVVLSEEPASDALSVGIEGDGLNGQVTDVPSHDDANEAEQAARKR